MKSSKYILLLLFCSVISIILYSQHFFTDELSTIEKNIEIVQHHHLLQSSKVVDIQTKINKVPLLLWKFTLADAQEKKLYFSTQLYEQIEEIEDEQLLSFTNNSDETALYSYVQTNWLGYKQLVLTAMDSLSTNDTATAREAMALSLIYLERVNDGMKLIVDFHQNDVSQKTANITATAQNSRENVLGFSLVAIVSFLFIVFFTFRKLILTENQLRKQVSELAEKNALLAEKNLRIKQLAFEDSLTGLANRYSFQAALTRELGDNSSNTINGAVVFFDIDGFKQVNDVHGHAVGDELLAVIGARIKSLIDDTPAFGARFGGDEFALFFKEFTAKDISPVLDKLLEIVFVPVEIQGITFHPTASIGVAFYPHQGTTAAGLLKKADMAMYQAKAKKNAYVLYSE